MNNDLKLIIGVIIATAGLLIGSVVFLSRGSGSSPADTTPTPASLQLRDEGYNTKGSDQPGVILVEFSDFQCPACKALSPLLKQLLDLYPQQLRLVYQHFPLPQHQMAKPAAEAAEAAGAQGKFWSMHDLLFSNQDGLSDQTIRDLATQIPDLNIDQFNQALSQHTFKNKVDRDLQEGNRLRIDATPTLYINGLKFTQPYALANLQAAIDTAISSSMGINPSVATDSATPSTATDSSPRNFEL